MLLVYKKALYILLTLFSVSRAYTSDSVHDKPIVERVKRDDALLSLLGSQEDVEKFWSEPLDIEAKNLRAKSLLNKAEDYFIKDFWTRALGLARKVTYWELCPSLRSEALMLIARIRKEGSRSVKRDPLVELGCYINALTIPELSPLHRANALFGMGEILYGQILNMESDDTERSWDMALECFMKALERPELPSSCRAQALFYAGSICSLTSKTSQEVKYYQDAISMPQLDPCSRSIALMFLGKRNSEGFFGDQDKYVLALRYFEGILRINEFVPEECASALFDMGNIYFEGGFGVACDKEKAGECYRKALMLNKLPFEDREKIEQRLLLMPDTPLQSSSFSDVLSGVVNPKLLVGPSDIVFAQD
jgi:tetratricopeptide (TPR) repeat protein